MYLFSLICLAVVWIEEFTCYMYFLSTNVYDESGHIVFLSSLLKSISISLAGVLTEIFTCYLIIDRVYLFLSSTVYDGSLTTECTCFHFMNLH